MTHFLLKLHPPRPSFALDMTDTERQLMQSHMQYWTRHLDQGQVIVFGPVLESGKAWGLGILKMADATAVASFIENDPVVKANIGFTFEFHPMLSAVYRAVAE